jgi:hypothetical protein
MGSHVIADDWLSEGRTVAITTATASRNLTNRFVSPGLTESGMRVLPDANDRDRLGDESVVLDPEIAPDDRPRMRTAFTNISKALFAPTDERQSDDRREPLLLNEQPEREFDVLQQPHPE